MSLTSELLVLAESIAIKAGELLVNRPSKFELDQKSGVFNFRLGRIFFSCLRS